VNYLGCKARRQCSRQDKTSPVDGFESLEVVPNVDDGSFLSISFLVTDAWKILQLSLLSETAVTPFEIRCSLAKRSVIYATSTKTNNWTKSSSISS
jgi:hypothetical protein